MKMLDFQSFPPIDRVDLENISSRLAGILNKLDNCNILLTGGTGFIGRWLVESFLHYSEKYDLRNSLTVLSRNPGNFLREMPHLAMNKRLSFLQGDIRNFSLPDVQITHIIHGAATPNSRLNSENPNEMFQTIVEGTRHVLNLAVEYNIKRLLLISTSSIYGNNQSYVDKLNEDCNISPDPYNNKLAYCEGKRVAEFLSAFYANEYHLSIPVARVFHQIGAHIPLITGNALGDFINDVLNNRPITLKSDGSSYRSYMYGTDLSVWLYTILLNGGNKPYNVGTDKGMFLYQIAEMIGHRYGIPVSKRSVNTQFSQLGIIPCLNRSSTELGLNAEVGFMNAIEKTIEWYRRAMSFSCGRHNS